MTVNGVIFQRRADGLWAWRKGREYRGVDGDDWYLEDELWDVREQPWRALRDRVVGYLGALEERSHFDPGLLVAIDDPSWIRLYAEVSEALGVGYRMLLCETDLARPAMGDLGLECDFLGYDCAWPGRRLLLCRPVRPRGGPRPRALGRPAQRQRAHPHAGGGRGLPVEAREAQGALPGVPLRGGRLRRLPARRGGGGPPRPAGCPGPPGRGSAPGMGPSRGLRAARGLLRGRPLPPSLSRALRGARRQALEGPRLRSRARLGAGRARVVARRGAWRPGRGEASRRAVLGYGGGLRHA